MIHSIFKHEIAFSVPVILEKDGTGYYASCPALKGVHVGGPSEKKAIKNVKKACSLYLQSMIKHDDAIPLDTESNLENVRNIVVEVML